MPRFHLHVHDRLGVTEDFEGRELPTLAVGGKEAVKGVRSILSHDVSQGILDLRGRMEVADSDGEVLLVIAFADALELCVP